MTNQRKIILDFLKDNYNHPSVEAVYKYVKKKLPQISKKTVYLNLQFLSDNGFIQEVKIKGVQRYEPKAKLHPHFMCKKCGKVIDLQSEKICKDLNEFKKKIKKIKIQSYSVNFYGLCEKCKEEEKNVRRKHNKNAINRR